MSDYEFIAAHERFRSESPVNAMTVDVEDYFQVSAFEGQVDRNDWYNYPCRVPDNVSRILQLFSDASVRATFFTLGWIAERFPQTIREIVAQGHELGSHGFDHTRVVNQTPSEFRSDVERTKKLLEDTAGTAVHGYRAASYSIGADNLWALGVLGECGYRYSSSIYPIRHDLYGMPDAPRFAFTFNRHGILEVPVTTVSLLGCKIPCGGGGYFRLFPYAFSRWAIRRVNLRDRQPSVFYFHPWELDPEQPRFPGTPLKTRFRHYLNLHRMRSRLQRLLQDFRWGRMDEIFDTAVGD